MNPIKEMFALQKALNDATNGEIWTEGATKEKRIISWHRCIYMEAAEAIDSFNWKHWKDIEAVHEWDNARVELVDIWHFIMSEGIHIGDTAYAEAFIDIEPDTEPDGEKLIEIFEKIVAASSQSCVDHNHNNFHTVVNLFFEALKTIGMDVNELYKRYVVKNQLNQFRQNHGYKDGTYKKIWDAVEDNVIAFNIMEDHPDFTPEQLYKKLEKEYANVE